MPDGREARLTVVLQRQHGAFTSEQARRCGFSPSTISRRVATGRWRSPFHGVYVEASSPSVERDALAAVLACGPVAFASHETAARLLGLDLPAPAVERVTVPHAARARRDVLTIRSRHLTRVDVARVRGVPVTSAVRTLADLAGVLSPDLLELSLDALWRRGTTTPERLLSYLSLPRNMRRPGTGGLRAIAAERAGQRPPDSDLETIYMQILKRFGVPLPVRQHPVAARSGLRRIDLCYPDHRLAIELDGFGAHARDRRTFEDDRVRRNDLEALRYSVRQFTWTQCLHDPVYVATTTAEAIGLVPARWRPAPH